MEGEVLSIQDLFLFKQTGLDADRRAQGYFQASGLRPQCMTRLESSGMGIPLSLFQERILMASAGKAES
jgi:pilus assembly protein CpaF